MYHLICKNCNKQFTRSKQNFNRKSKVGHFCSTKCWNKFCTNKIECTCNNCPKKFYRNFSECNKPNNFCSKSCAAVYNNTHKKHGTRVSKLELFIQSELPVAFPNLEFLFNRKDAINSELDIYIPSINLAFELNGIFHYEPIYGKEKLKNIITNDTRKFQACLEKNIELCIVDTSTFTYFKPEKARKFLEIIIEIINQKL